MEADQTTKNLLSTRNNRVIRLPMEKDGYTTVISDAGLFRAYLDEAIVRYPELFPKEITRGYRMKDLYKSKKTGLYFRRITVDNTAYSVRPSFVSPYLSA